MVIKNTTQLGQKVIRQKSNVVKNISTPEIQQTIKDLVDSMRYHNLVGMAAPQIGKKWKIFVSEIRPTTYRKNISALDSLRIFINPTITWKSKTLTAGYEGCGSVASAQLFGIVKRPKSVICKAFNEKGEIFTIKAAGLLARVIQHEFDHLNGIVFIDRLADTKSLMDRKTYISSQKK